MNRMLGISALGLIFLSVTPSVSRAQEGGQGKWVTIFDGKSMEGWEYLELGEKGSSKWELKDGAIQGSGAASMIFSPRGDYKNFKVRAEVKINDKGNSGLYFRAEKKNTFTVGYEAQIDSTHADPIRTGSIYTMVHIFDRLVEPDTWFVYEIEVKDINYRGRTVTSITPKVNDKILYTFQDFEQTFKSGHIAFQQHNPGSEVSIRKVEIMELP